MHRKAAAVQYPVAWVISYSQQSTDNLSFPIFLYWLHRSHNFMLMSTASDGINHSFHPDTPAPEQTVPVPWTRPVNWLKLTLTWQKGEKNCVCKDKINFQPNHPPVPFCDVNARTPGQQADSEVPRVRTNGWGWRGQTAHLQASASWAASARLLHFLQDLCYHCPETEFDRPAAAHNSRHRNNSAHTVQVCCFLTRPHAGPGLPVHCVLQTTSARLVQGNHLMIQFNSTLEAPARAELLEVRVGHVGQWPQDLV